jgi:hypothetical protein
LHNGADFHIGADVAILEGPQWSWVHSPQSDQTCWSSESLGSSRVLHRDQTSSTVATRLACLIRSVYANKMWQDHSFMLSSKSCPMASLHGVYVKYAIPDLKPSAPRYPRHLHLLHRPLLQQPSQQSGSHFFQSALSNCLFCSDHTLLSA